VTRPRKDPDDDDSGLVRRLLPFERDFTQIPNDWLRDERLSYRARGLLALLMTHDHGYRVTLKGLASATPKAAKGEGLDGLRAAVEELEATGYLFRRPSKKGGRFVADRWEICDPSGTYDPGLFSLAGVVDNPHRNRVASARAERTALAQTTRTALAQTTTVRTQARTRAERAPSARSGAAQVNDDLWKTSLAEQQPCSSPRGHAWPSARAASAYPDGLVPCERGCGVVVSAMFLAAKAVGA
jgi:hypothetical protein